MGVSWVRRKRLASFRRPHDHDGNGNGNGNDNGNGVRGNANGKGGENSRECMMQFDAILLKNVRKRGGIVFACKVETVAHLGVLLLYSSKVNSNLVWFSEALG